MDSLLKRRRTAEKSIAILKNGISVKSKIMIVSSTDLIQTEEFSWDDLDDLYQEWDQLWEKATDILEDE